MIKSIKNLGALVLLLGTLGLAGCGGGSSDVSSGQVLLACSAPQVPSADGSSCVAPPPISCPAPTVPDANNENCVVGANPALPDPVFFPSETQAVLYYNRLAAGATNEPNDASYEGWRLHTWNNDACTALMPDSVAPSWDNGLVHDGIDPNYGAYWILDLVDGFGDCHNFIIHIGTDDAGKEMGGGDFRGNLVQDDERFARMNFTLTGEPTVYEFPLISLGERPVQIDGMAAHWLDADTILWNAPEGVESVKLHYSLTAGIEATIENGLNGTAADLTAIDLSDEQQAIAPYLNDLQAYQGAWTVDDAKAVLTGQAVLGGYDVDGALIAATGVQIAKALDSLYTTGEADADEAQLGLVYSDAGITSNVWAPTAQDVNLKVYNAEKRLQATHEMSKNADTGVWSYTGTGIDRMFYRFEITVFHPVTGEIETYEVTDPYSVSLGVNGRFSQFVNLADDDLKPEGWDTHSIPVVANPEDSVIYEGHIRDFSALDASTSAANRGKFLAFTEEDTTPVNHLTDLVDAGVTHFHFLPSNDIATIDERESATVDLNSTVFELCLLNRRLEICEDESIRDMTLQQVYESYDAFLDPDKAQELAQQIRALDQFNWGYDPHHFNAPEGSYSSDPDGVARIIEKRAMIQSLHEMGLRTVMDVVYNHTNASGLNDKSVLDRVVPGYYHRYDPVSGGILRTSCCDDTDDRNAMMAKFMEDSLLIWTEHYKFGGFRFDLMGLHSRDTILSLRDAVQAVDPDNYFYGEGWTMPDRGVTQANQPNLAGSEVGTFNDRLREAVRQGEFFARNSDDNGSKLNAGDRIKVGLAGTLSDFILEDQNGVSAQAAALGGYAADPADIINYVSKHDGNTLFDQLNYVLPNDLTLAQRVRAQNMAMGITVMSQGIPFLQMGGDLIRSKSMDRNTYDAGDWFNRVDFTKSSNNWNVGLPLAEDNAGAWDTIGAFVYSPERAVTMTDIEFASDVFQELLGIRMSSPLFRLTTGDDIKARVGFHNIGRSAQPGLIAMSIDDGTGLTDLDANHDAVMVVINSNYDEASIRVNTATGFELHDMQVSSVDPVVRSASFAEGIDDDEGNGLFTVPAQTIAVFVKPQGAEQGAGLSSFATSGAPDVVPYGSTVVYLRGGMNEWGTSTPFTYQGDGVYTTTFDLEESATHEFKVAEADWGTPNLGAPDGESNLVVEDSTFALAPSNNNLSFTADATASYEFILDAADLDNPTLLVRKDNPYFGTEIYVRGVNGNWGTDFPMSYDGGKVFSSNITLNVGDMEFKVASEDWSTVDHGAVDGSDEARNVSVGTPIAANLAGGDNFRLSIDSEEEYAVTLDLSDAAFPTIGVFKRQFFGANTVYVRGGMNGWGANAGEEMVYADGMYTVSLPVSAGVSEFKVATEDWGAVNLGVADAENPTVTLGTPFLMLDQSQTNIRLDVTETGNYTFTVKGPNPLSPTVTVTRDE